MCWRGALQESLFSFPLRVHLWSARSRGVRGGGKMKGKEREKKNVGRQQLTAEKTTFRAARKFEKSRAQRQN